MALLTLENLCKVICDLSARISLLYSFFPRSTISSPVADIHLRRLLFRTMQSRRGAISHTQPQTSATIADEHGVPIPESQLELLRRSPAKSDYSRKPCNRLDGSTERDNADCSAGEQTQVTVTNTDIDESNSPEYAVEDIGPSGLTAVDIEGGDQMTVGREEESMKISERDDTRQGQCGSVSTYCDAALNWMQKHPYMSSIAGLPLGGRLLKHSARFLGVIAKPEPILKPFSQCLKNDVGDLFGIEAWQSRKTWSEWAIVNAGPIAKGLGGAVGAALLTIATQTSAEWVQEGLSKGAAHATKAYEWLQSSWSESGDPILALPIESHPHTEEPALEVDTGNISDEDADDDEGEAEDGVT